MIYEMMPDNQALNNQRGYHTEDNTPLINYGGRLNHVTGYYKD